MSNFEDFMIEQSVKRDDEVRRLKDERSELRARVVELENSLRAAVTRDVNSAAHNAVVSDLAAARALTSRLQGVNARLFDDLRSVALAGIALVTDPDASEDEANAFERICRSALAAAREVTP